MHFDPEFKTFTYGDPTSKRKYLLKLEKDGILVFYAGLSPYQNDKQKAGLYIIGYFTIQEILDFNELTKEQIKGCYKKYYNNAHIKRNYGTEDLVIIVGKRSLSRLLDKAILISGLKMDKRGRPYHAVSQKMEKLLGISGSIQRSIPPRFINGNPHIKNLKKILQIN
jgi:hypothetical protein